MELELGIRCQDTLIFFRHISVQMWSPFDICETDIPDYGLAIRTIFFSHAHSASESSHWSFRQARELPDFDESVNDVAVHHRKRVEVR